jgi:AraC family transcriptional regulator
MSDDWDWVYLESGRPRHICEFVRYDGNLSTDKSWTGLRLAQGECQPAQLPEGYFRAHLVSLHLGEPAIVERHVVGHRRRTETAPTESLLVFPAKAPFTLQWQSRLPRLDLLIEPELFSNVVGQDVAANRLELRPTYSAGDPFIAQALYALRQDAREGFPRGRLYGETLGTALVVHLLRHYGAQETFSRTPKGRLPPNRLRRVVEYINDRLETDLSLPELAGVVGLNPDYFARTFKQTTGVSPHRYVLLKRIDRACALLKDSPISIVEISQRSGFASQSAFTTAFGRIQGITPSAYRRALL